MPSTPPSATPGATDTTAATDAISWYEIPCADLDRAQAFYETVLARRLRREQMGGAPLAVFPYARPATGGALIALPEGAAAGARGLRIYLDAGPRLDAVLDRVAAAGGRVTQARTALPPGMGFIAELCDTEGNHVGLHALA